MCLVSIIVPVYNVERYLTACLDSIFRQSHERIEVIAVNDGSTDASSHILQQYTDKGHPFRMITQTNQGVSEARNVGLRAAKGEYVLFVDSDDFVEEDIVSKSLSAAQETDADIVLFDFRHTDDTGKPTQTFRNDHLGLPALTCLDIAQYPKIFLSIPSPCCRIYRRSFLVNNKLYFKRGIWFEDLLFFLKCLLYRPQYCYLPEILYNYRQHGLSTTKSFRSEKNTDILIVFENVLADYKAAGVYETYQNEIEFLALEHIYTGILYILAKGGRFELYQDVKQQYFQLFPQKRPDLRRRLPFKKRLIAKLIDLNFIKLIHLFKGA
ncbi:MAG TPA: glycosyltransferase [Clostridiaceae bacterium]|nr:glycosyltransferase [Clostridiaceae bacterium]